MAAPSTKKRSHPDSANPEKKQKKRQKPNRKQRAVLQYNSDSEEDLNNAFANDVGRLSGSDVDSDGETHAFNPATRKRMVQPEPKSAKPKTTKPKNAKKNPIPEDKSDEQDGAGAESDDNDDDDDDVDEEDDDDNFDMDDEVEDDFTDSEGETSNVGSKRPKSKRNDPGAFATSLQKILSTKLSTSKRADAILSRSVEAQKASKEIVDATLEAKARKLLREKKLLAQEKGRVKDVLNGDDPEGSSIGENMQLERRLRKTAHRGVIMLFRAVREAQERATQAEEVVKKEGIIGSHRQEKVNEMSKQGFLDLIAGAGGKMKKGGIEEA